MLKTEDNVGTHKKETQTKPEKKTKTKTTTKTTTTKTSGHFHTILKLLENRKTLFYCL